MSVVFFVHDVLSLLKHLTGRQHAFPSVQECSQNATVTGEDISSPGSEVQNLILEEAMAPCNPMISQQVPTLPCDQAIYDFEDAFDQSAGEEPTCDGKSVASQLLSLRSRDELEHSFEGAFDEILYKHTLDTSTKGCACEANDASDADYGQARYYEINSFATIKEVDCESDASADVGYNPRSNVEDVIIATCVPDQTTPSTSVDSSQVSTDTLDLVYEDVPLACQSSPQSFGTDTKDFGIAFDSAPTFEQPQYLSASSSITFSKHAPEGVGNLDEFRDTVDLMGMAIF